MTDPGQPRGWNPLDVAASTGVAATCQAAFWALRPLVVGRPISVQVGDEALVLTITRMNSSLDLGRLVAGRHHDVRLEAHDLSWRGHRFERAEVVLRSLHFRGHLRSTELVAAPVELTLEVAAPALDEVFTWAAPQFIGDIGPDGVARLHLAKRRGSGYVEVDARLDGSTLWVTPRAVVRRRRWVLPARTPSYRVRVPELPNGLELTSIEFTPGTVRLTGTLPQWRVDVPRTRFDDVMRQLSAVGRPLRILWPSTAGIPR